MYKLTTKLVLWGLFLFFLSPTIQAQISISGTPPSFQAKQLFSLDKLPIQTTPELDLDQVEEEDRINETNGGMPTRFGIEQDVNYTLSNTGKWETLPNGDRIWRLKITAPEALSINLIYNNFFMPKGAKFYIYNPEKTQILGAFTSINNKPDAAFGTALLYGETSILEYHEPASVKGQGRISISTVVHGYRYIFKNNAHLGSSGTCNVDVICPDGDLWRDEIKAVAKIVIGGGLCSGSLLGNTNRDCTPYFLTANHCGFSNVVVFYWNFERPNCGNGTPDDTQTTNGAIGYANSVGGGVIQSDFNLWKLSESPVDAGYDVHFLGWDAREMIADSVVGIHHPAGDAKKISYANSAVMSTPSSGNTATPGATHWRVAAWDNGTTEGGSSGSPLIDQTSRRVVGKLSGGFAACNAATGVDNDEPDWYGKLSYSWLNDGAIPTSRLKDWLDNADTNELFIDGYKPVDCVTQTCSDGIQNQDETGIDCGGVCSACVCPATATLTITSDQYPAELTWILQTIDGEVVAKGGTYTNVAPLAVITETLCLDMDCYTFSMSDFFADGMCCTYGNGSYTLVSDVDGSTLASGSFTGAYESTYFCMSSAALDLKLVLGGAYDNGVNQMKTDLGSELIPLNSPYGDGVTTTKAVIAAQNIVDWVKVEVRTSAAPHAIVAYRGALLKNTGKIVDIDGITPVSFSPIKYPSITSGTTYRVAVRHRNHLGVMSAASYVLR